MSFSKTALLLVLAGLAASACASNPALPGRLPVGRSFDLRSGATAEVEGEIHTQPAQSVVVHGSHQVSRSALAPYPRSDRPTRPEDYVATFTVTPR